MPVKVSLRFMFQMIVLHLLNFGKICAGLVNEGVEPTSTQNDRLLGGLMAPGLDELSCLSRYQYFRYRKTSRKPSSYLISRLRSYEQLHRRCGPNTESFKKSLQQVQSGHIDNTSDCNYVVWTFSNGLGNRMISIASSFLYALLTDRVLLIHHVPDIDMAELFCEPFPNSTWFLPLENPFNDDFKIFNGQSPKKYGNLVMNKKINTSTMPPPTHLYHYIAYDFEDQDKVFYQDEHQAFLVSVPWLILKSDEYFAPSFFLMRSFRQELDMLFPDKETVFHLLGRYLFLPSNEAWGLITRFYDAYLANADERIGIQIRVVNTQVNPFQSVMDGMLACLSSQKILPDVVETKKISTETRPRNQRKSKAVLIASLFPQYYENMKSKYWTRPTVTGELVGVYQPSHEEYQQFGNNMHNVKAWAEMNLLSLCDVLVTSSWSTFGYVAQALGDLKPWILYTTDSQVKHNPSCLRALSMEPCFHFPPILGCQAKYMRDNQVVFPPYNDCKPHVKLYANTSDPVHVQHCEDSTFGYKLVHQKHLV
ncbi:galactoside 2-alpha-L-fucosyltransferase-like [Tripterygium wilfordii]|uniref:galactoside 2-alpha-L-fucosyltransferase-like n=1 Tax=Tripterygium wilfordii TaxID=458696 RepID=UPI0018F863EB|nr:galactoside 2-alpha-L-fucosyltransferase-like [Tripterygium wilfordii]